MTFENLVKQRYSVRKYDSRPVEPEKMKKILEAGRLAPTACNFQPQRILVTPHNVVFFVCSGLNIVNFIKKSCKF